MAKFTFTEKAWDAARPASVKKTGIGDAIKAALKALPGADTEGAKTPADCVKAQDALLTLGKALAGGLSAVQKASDDKKGAAKLLKGWIEEVERGEAVIKTRKIDLVEAVTNPAMKKWLPVRKDLEKKVMDLTERIKAADTNGGHAEQMIEEATMAMILRAEELRSTGHTGTTPPDFLDDSDYRKQHAVYEDMVKILVDTSKAILDAQAESKQLKAFILNMRNDMKAAADEVGEYVNLPSDNLRAFKLLLANVEEFWTHTCSDRATQYATFAWIADPVPPGNVRAQQDKQLANRFVKVKKVDAESFHERALAKYALNDRQLKKTIPTVQALSGAVTKLAQQLREARERGEDDVQAQQAKLLELHAALENNLKKHRMGRNEGDVIQALSRPENAKMREFIDKALEFFEKAVLASEKAVKELT